MKTLDEQLLRSIIKFSITFNVSAPKTNDLFHWWKEALNEMQLRDIKLLYLALSEHDGKGLADHFPKMVEMLKEKYNQLHYTGCINL